MRKILPTLLAGVALSALSAAALSGCGEKEETPEQSILSLDKENIAASASAGRHAIIVTSDSHRGWQGTVSENAKEWCNKNRYISGSGNDTIFVTVDENFLPTERTATITVSCGTQSAAVTLTQAGAAQVQGTFTMTTGSKSNKYSSTTRIKVAAQRIMIDWGDGSTNNYDYSTSPDEAAEAHEITHRYSKPAEAHTITVIATTLRELECNDDMGNLNLISLDVSGLTTLTRLTCYSNDSLTSLNVNGCTALKSINCQYCNLTDLDVSSCAALEFLILYDNYNLASLNVANNAALRVLSVGCRRSTEPHSKGLATLDVSSNPALEQLICYGHLLTSLDVSSNVGLTTLDCTNNYLTSLNIGSNAALTRVSTPQNQLSADALNAMLTALPTVSVEAKIYIQDNPGTSTCNKTIAMVKGWTFAVN
jgi:hypothetical protein